MHHVVVVMVVMVMVMVMMMIAMMHFMRRGRLRGSGRLLSYGEAAEADGESGGDK
jgi:hypothetical protein